ncbi:MAG: hypothetical protein ACRDKF_10455 [Actinomycetota bacterium]
MTTHSSVLTTPVNDREHSAGWPCSVGVTPAGAGVSAGDVAALIAVVAIEPSAPSLIEFGGPEAINRNQSGPS